MRSIRIIAALAFILAPGLAVAQGCSWGHPSGQATVSCADGTQWDAETQTCVATVTS